MFVDNSFFSDGDAKRLSFGITGALLIHALILIWFYLPTSQKVISADILSPPTNISIRFITPTKLPPKLMTKVAKIKAVQNPLPEILNKIEPAAASQMETPPQEITPVVSGSSLKGRRVQPKYPKRALRLHQEGVVWLHVLINKEGARRDIKLHRPAQYVLLNQAAIKAVKKWTFDPNIVNGRAVQSWVEIPIEFKIQ